MNVLLCSDVVEKHQSLVTEKRKAEACKAVNGTFICTFLASSIEIGAVQFIDAGFCFNPPISIWCFPHL